MGEARRRGSFEHRRAWSMWVNEIRLRRLHGIRAAGFFAPFEPTVLALSIRIAFIEEPGVPKW